MKKKSNKWLENTYYVGMLASILFIVGQAFYTRRSMIQSSEWEKAKVTIENIERFKENLKGSPLDSVWMLGDKIWADFSTRKGWDLSDTLRVIYFSLYDNDEKKTFDECVKMIEVLDAFAYPIIMGYASEFGSYQNVARQFHTYGNFVIPIAFRGTPNIGFHAKLLYRLWRIRFEVMVIDNFLNSDKYDLLMERKDHLLYYEETDFTEASLKKYKKKLEGKLSEIQKEIEVFRKNSLK